MGGNSRARPVPNSVATLSSARNWPDAAGILCAWGGKRKSKERSRRPQPIRHLGHQAVSSAHRRDGKSSRDRGSGPESGDSRARGEAVGDGVSATISGGVEHGQDRVSSGRLCHRIVDGFRFEQLRAGGDQRGAPPPGELRRGEGRGSGPAGVPGAVQLRRRIDRPLRMVPCAGGDVHFPRGHVVCARGSTSSSPGTRRS